MSSLRLSSPTAASYTSPDPLIVDEETALAGSGPASDAATVASDAVKETTRSARWIRIGLLALVLAVVVALGIVGAVKLAAHTSSSPSGPSDPSNDDVLASSYAGQYYVKAPQYVHNLTMPPRLQWNENYGYCGSTSFISAGLYMGGIWISQYENRALASNSTNQRLEESQLLLGVNDYWAAHAHKMTNKLWDYSDLDVTHFFAWIKSQILQNHPVVIGIFENSSVFGNTPPDPDYDHIVPVTGWGSNHPLSDPSYYADDVIYFSDNGHTTHSAHSLRAEARTPTRPASGLTLRALLVLLCVFLLQGLYTPVDPNVSVFECSAIVGQFAQSRKNADSKTAAVYSINGAPTSADPNFGIALTGIVDEHNDCMPLRVVTSTNQEQPEIVDGSNTRPAASPLTLTVIVSGLTVGTSYNLYQYNTMSNVPSSQFNANAGNAFAHWTFTASGASHQQTVDVMTSDLAVFRAVAASAP